jgi:hypothetical protein
MNALTAARLERLKRYAAPDCPECDGDGWIDVMSNSDPTDSFPLRCQCTHMAYLRENGPDDRPDE